VQGYDLKLLIPAALTATYLNAGTLGPTPSTALAAAAASELEWVESGPGLHTHYVNAKESVRGFARRVEERMPGGVVSLTENNSESILRVLWGLPWQPGDEVITTDHEHGAVVLALSSIMRRFDLKVKVARVESPEIGFMEQIRSMLGPRTRLVVMSHVSYLTGWSLPVAEVAELVHDWPRCRLLVDGAQALGNIVVNPNALGADYYVFCGHKWMMAPAGWAGLWIRRDRKNETATRWPLESYQMSVLDLEKGPFPDYSAGGEDLEFGTRCWPRVVGWSITWDYFEEEGFDSHAQYQRDLAQEARSRINQVKGLTVQDPFHDTYGSTSLMTVTSRQLGSGLAEWLLERGVVTKPQAARHGVRISWASFNTEDDIDHLMDAAQGL
jgi:L-cysteine/cystine lyase